MTTQAKIPTVPLLLVAGVPWAPPPYTYASDQGSTVWTAGRAYAANAVVQAAPNNLSPFPAILPLFYLALNAGSAGATPPAWPTSYGQTVVDGGITWICVAGTAYAVNVTGYTASWDFLSEPDDQVPPILSLTAGSGLVLGGAAGTFAPTLTANQIATLLAVQAYGFHRLIATPPAGNAVRILQGPWQVQR